MAHDPPAEDCWGERSEPNVHGVRHTSGDRRERDALECPLLTGLVVDEGPRAACCVNGLFHIWRGTGCSEWLEACWRNQYRQPIVHVAPIAAGDTAGAQTPSIKCSPSLRWLSTGPHEAADADTDWSG